MIFGSKKICEKWSSIQTEDTVRYVCTRDKFNINVIFCGNSTKKHKNKLHSLK